MPISPKTLDFLFENRLNNSKEWFHSHKADYETYVLQPLVELVEQLTSTMLEIDPSFIIIPKCTKTISRIYRDTRFSKDKSLYRSNMWLTFMRDKKLYHGCPAYYVDISGEGYECGVGYYKASSETIRTYREMILNREPSFLRAKECLEKMDGFTHYNDLLKRSKAPDQPADIRDWLDRRGIGVSKLSQDFDTMFSPQFAQALSGDLLGLKPIYEFYQAVEARRAHNS